MIDTEATLEFWKNMALGLKDELVERGDSIDDLTAKVRDLQEQVDGANELILSIPVDDIFNIVARYTFLVERGQDAVLDRVNVWMNKVKPLDEDEDADDYEDPPPPHVAKAM